MIVAKDYECWAGPDACCPRCGDQIGHVRGHFYEDCLRSLREQLAKANARVAELEAAKESAP